MWAKGYIFLIGACYFYSEILSSQHASAEDIYLAELMVESNVTLEVTTILEILKNITTITVIDSAQNSHEVTFIDTESVAECLIVGVETSCNCSTGYIWSNEVCYNYNCCRETTCYQNVSYISPLCIPKIPVYVNGSVTMNTRAWVTADETIAKTEFEKLNGFESMNFTGLSLSGMLVEFEVGLSVKFATSRLQTIINELQTILAAYIRVDTTGLVTIESPQYKVCYQSSPILKCTFDEMTDKAGWNMSTTYERFELNNGSVVMLDHACKNLANPSCVAVTLKAVTGVWEGTYECGFTKGSVRHTAKAYLSVARLPDSILLTTNPITGDCSNKAETDSINVNVTATVLKTNNTYDFTWKYNTNGAKVQPVDVDKNSKYTFIIKILCTPVSNAQTVTVTFKNDINQTKSATVTIPVIYGGAKFCKNETVDGVFWPKTPAGDTAVNNTCSAGRVGFKTRTCMGTMWDTVFDSCVNQELNKISNAADSFLKGLGATEDVALDIFSGLDNNTLSSGGDGDNIADLSASINVMDMMAQASKNIPLGEKVLPSFVNAASNMLNKTWTKVNTSLLHNMSANYLQSLEGLVQNIGVNMSNNNTDYNTPNLDLKYCMGDDCSVNVFGVNVNLNKSSGIMKTVAVKNLMHKLKNTYKKSSVTELLVSTTLENNSDSSIQIKMAFTATPGENQVPYCVFWDTKMKDWDDMGCKVVSEGNKSGVFCECSHLTSFSVLMARGDVSNPILDVITYVGLAVSIVSLIIFLIIEYLVWSAVVKTKLSHYRHTCMVNIAFFLLLADICFLASVDPPGLSDDMCLVLTICKHLFFTVKFCWMLCLSAMLVHQLIFVFNPLRKKVFMFFSSLVGYMFPIVMVGSSYIYYRYTGKPYHNKDTCWLTYERLLVGSLHAFLLPIGTILLSNIFSMGVVIVTLLKSSKNDSSKADEKDTAKSIIKVILVLAPVFGVTWSIGFCLVVFNTSNPAYPFFNYTFTIVNSFQGLFVLFTGFLSEKKVKDELTRIVFGKGGSSDSTKNLTSTMYTKDK
ncbi:adhesion G protein-coupled receptor F5 [Boleophthalmus pectinirostris]|uniref:adhesion G protein-coupled receptor F5 n=1 Tax=Boleophthalmus pectinirostris TaxID=150288 RepID=UPI00242F8AD4|nr:adhesion G protein-coupled receptor F5 [Boleophthalmus pectinirostris]